MTAIDILSFLSSKRINHHLRIVGVVTELVEAVAFDSGLLTNAFPKHVSKDKLHINELVHISLSCSSQNC
jgi:HD superfamily phosphohydrolase YqeK